MEHRYADVNGVRLHYVEAGDGPLMVFVHGFPEFWYVWRKLIPEFARDHRVVAYDQRGFNLSSKPSEVAGYHTSSLIEDLRHFIDHLTAGRENKRCTLVAHDWGGAMAWVFAAAYPQYLDKLVIINGPHAVPFQRELINNPQQQAASAYMLRLRTPGVEAVLGANNYAYLASIMVNAKGQPVLTEEEVAQYKEAWNQPGALNAQLNFYRATELVPATPEHPGAAAVNLVIEKQPIPVPTLVIWADADHALLPGNLDGLADYVPDLRIEHIPGASHWVIHEQPEHVAGLIRAFVA